MIYKKYHEFATFLIALTCKLDFLLDIKRENIQKPGFELLVLLYLDLPAIKLDFFT